MQIKRSGHGRLYIDKDGEVQYEYQEPASMNPKLVEFLLDCFHSRDKKKAVKE